MHSTVQRGGGRFLRPPPPPTPPGACALGVSLFLSLILNLPEEWQWLRFPLVNIVTPFRLGCDRCLYGKVPLGVVNHALSKLCIVSFGILSPIAARMPATIWELQAQEEQGRVDRAGRGSGIEIYFQQSDDPPASDGSLVISRVAAFDTVIKAINHAEDAAGPVASRAPIRSLLDPRREAPLSRRNRRNYGCETRG